MRGALGSTGVTATGDHMPPFLSGQWPSPSSLVSQTAGERQPAVGAAGGGLSVRPGGTTPPGGVVLPGTCQARPLTIQKELISAFL